MTDSNEMPVTPSSTLLADFSSQVCVVDELLNGLIDAASILTARALSLPMNGAETIGTQTRATVLLSTAINLRSQMHELKSTETFERAICAQARGTIVSALEVTKDFVSDAKKVASPTPMSEDVQAQLVRAESLAAAAPDLADPEPVRRPKALREEVTPSRVIWDGPKS